MKEALDYYLTSRAQHPYTANKMWVRSLPLDAFHFAEIFLKQLALLIAGEKAGSRWDTEKLDKQIGGGAKVIVPMGRTWISMIEISTLM